MKVAIFGGTFDPVHTAHLTVAREARDRLAYDEVLFVPAGNPPHKAGTTTAGFDHRFRMVELACQDEARFSVSRIEEGHDLSYTIHTIERLRAERPGDAFSFLIGADAFADIRSWHRWRDVAAAVSFLVVSRPGHVIAAPPETRVERLETVALPVSSSEIRDELARHGSSALLPGAVMAYIAAHGLYR
jgi:nicotinate-nucleotide adenylyltransferase